MQGRMSQKPSKAEFSRREGVNSKKLYKDIQQGHYYELRAVLEKEGRSRRQLVWSALK